MYKVHSSCGFQQGDNIGITSSTCRHCTLSNSIMYSDSYPIPILSLLFIPSLYPLLFNSKNFYLFSSLLPFFYCMHSHQVYNSNGGLAPKIRFSTWTKLDGYSYEQAQHIGPSKSKFLVKFHMLTYWAVGDMERNMQNTF